MPKINEGAARVQYKFKGKTVGVPTHYAVGHTMDENDARFANRQLASVLGNVLASALNRLAEKRTEDNSKLPDGDPNKGKVVKVEDITDAEAQTMFDTIYGNYEIGVNNNRGDGTGVSHDPVEAIARNIAWERVKVLLKDRNIKVSSVNAEKKGQLVGQMLERDPSIRAAAKAQFEGNGSTTALDDSLFAGLATAEGNDTNSGASTSAGDSNVNTITGGQGNDSITSSGGNDTISGDTTANPGTVSNASEGTGQGTPEDGQPVIGATNAGTEADAEANEGGNETDEAGGNPDVDPNSGVTSPGGAAPGGAFA